MSARLMGLGLVVVAIVIGLALPARAAGAPMPAGPWIQQAKLTANNGLAHDAFGSAVAVSGNTALVGAQYEFNNRGAVFVFVRLGKTWILQQELLPILAGPNAHFGYSVAISGDTAVVGALSGVSTTGATFVYTRRGTVWNLQQELTFPDGAVNNLPAFSVALDGDILAIGSPYTGRTVGEVDVYRHTGATWTMLARLTPPNPTSLDLFGNAVAVHGGTVAVGAPRESHTGAVYVFVANVADVTLQQELTASDGLSGAGFGDSVGLSGDTLVAGADEGDIQGAAGAAYVFARAGTLWQQQAKLTASDGAPSDDFGVAVAISGDTIVVGAYGHNASTGAAYAFTRAYGTWSQQQELVALDGQTGDTFGVPIAISGDTILAGAYAAFNFYAIEAAYVFVRA